MLDGQLICFSCGSGIDGEEHYFCVSRLRQIKGKADEDEDRIVGATASLQICTNCKVGAATKDITFPELPLPVLNLEKRGFNQFAKWRAGKATESESIAKGRNSCSLCRAAIGAGDAYRRIQLTEEVQNATDIEVKEAYTLAILCENCAEKYMVWL